MRGFIEILARYGIPEKTAMCVYLDFERRGIAGHLSRYVNALEGERACGGG